MPTPAPRESPRLRDSATLRFLFWPAVWLTLFLLLFATWRLYWKVQLMNEIAKVREAGYPASPAEVEAWYKKPEGENAADYWMKAHAAWKTDQVLEDWLPGLSVSYEGGALLEYEEPKLGERYPDEVLDKTRMYFSKNTVSFHWMDKAAQVDGCRWPGDFSKGPELLVPYLAEQRQMGRRLGERLGLTGIDGDWTTASALLACGFKQARDLGNGPLWLHGLAGGFISSNLLESIERLLPFMPPSSERLAALQTQLTNARHQQARAMNGPSRGEPGLMLGEDALFGSFGRQSPYTHGWRLLGGEDHDRAKLAAHSMRVAALLTHPETTQWAETKQLLDELKRHRPVWHYDLELALDSATWILPRHLDTLSRFDAATTALAAERFRLDTSHLPATLDELVPKYLPAVPPDLFDAGKPIKYKIEADRFTVYSAGKNGVDDGGKPDDLSFTILLPNAKRGVVQKRKPVEKE